MKDQSTIPVRKYFNKRDAKYDRYCDQEELELEIERDAKLLFKKKQLEKIEAFTGYFEFLNNDFPAEVLFDNHIYPCISSAYQAARAPDEKMKILIQKSPTLQAMYDISKTFDDPPDWPFKRLKVMEGLVRDKFRRKRELRDKLKVTQMRELIYKLEEETPENIFWGIVNGKGQNQLGRIFDQVRSDIYMDQECEHWLFVQFNLQDDKKYIPPIRIDVIKDKKSIENVTLENKAFFILGCLAAKCDYLMNHPSISRMHAALFHERKIGLMIVDLGSKAGTKVNGKQLKNCIPEPIQQGSEIAFGMSTRTYKVSIDMEVVKRRLEIEEKMIEKELKLLEKLSDPTLDVDLVKSSLMTEKKDTVFVGNLVYSVEKKDLESMFKECGKITEIRLPINKQNKNKGFAFITFETEEAGRQALRMSGLKLFDRKIKVVYADKRTDLSNFTFFVKEDNISKGPNKKGRRELKKKMEGELLSKKLDAVISEKHDERRSRSRSEESKSEESKSSSSESDSSDSFLSIHEPGNNDEIKKLIGLKKEEIQESQNKNKNYKNPENNENNENADKTEKEKN